jgi:hypothetical protein
MMKLQIGDFWICGKEYVNVRTYRKPMIICINELIKGNNDTLGYGINILDKSEPRFIATTPEYLMYDKECCKLYY